MKAKRLLFSVPLLALVFSGVSCVTDDWDSYSGNPYYGGQPRGYYYDAPDYRRPDYRHDDYRDRYDRHDRDDRYDRDDHHDRHGHRDDHRRTPKGYMLAGSFKAGDAIECGVPTSKHIRTVRLVATSGTFSVNTLVVREGSTKTPIKVLRRLSSGESAEIDLGGPRQATGFRISTNGKGEFDVFVH